MHSQIFFAENTDLLVDFLNSLLESRHGIIQSVTILNPELPGESIEDKNSVLDILAIDRTGKKFNIEMQTSFSPAYLNRIAFYAFRLFVNSLEKGEEYSKIPGVISVNLLDCNAFQGYRFHRVFQLLDTEDYLQMIPDALEFHFLELLKISSNPKQEEKLQSWLRFIKYSDQLEESEMAELKSKNKALETAEEVLDTMSQDSLTRLEYDKRKAAVFFNEMNLRDHYKKGKEEGIEQGVEKGAYQKACQTAKAMIHAGKLEFSEIAAYTDLTIEDIERLAKEID
jgi:predicted transposase/invertase (TIGR01784 family)